mmetsp:Transcript_1943/g.5565  ORF Transcript_1943/g.5565 Transcript_1943/m.5565 type:complete len:100 (-) Transcript_1943:1988-2287(-)
MCPERNEGRAPAVAAASPPTVCKIPFGRFTARALSLTVLEVVSSARREVYATVMAAVVAACPPTSCKALFGKFVARALRLTVLEAGALYRRLQRRARAA